MGTGRLGFSLHRFTLALFITTFISLLYYIRLDFSIRNSQQGTVIKTRDRYLIATSTCRIPEEDPFGEEVRSLFKRHSHISCSSRRLLTYIETRNSTSVLYINQSLLSSYSNLTIRCCYYAIFRIVEDGKPDDKIKLSDCKTFDKSASIEDQTIRVDCNDSRGIVYSNIHAVISEKYVTRRNGLDSAVQLPSVIIFGTDSLSRLNLMRTMPKTYNFLQERDFVNLRGYTKIGDNTFPNLMAVMTGKTVEQIDDFCNPSKFRVSNCNLIWDKFRELGYTTAYAEDEATVNTFSYNRQGFGLPPTDFYFKPYFVAAEQLQVIRFARMHFCTGPESSGERVMNIAKDFILKLKTFPKFGLFWTSSFTHNDINFPTSMDDKVVEFLSNIYDYLEDTFLIVMSDHGFRFGEIRFTHTGWVEERLPYIYIHVPLAFKEVYKKQYENLLTNSKRLTCPYDLYMTLRDILKIVNTSSIVEPSLACPNCRSLFEEVAENRTCQDAAIAKHWCLCDGLFYLDTELKIVKELGQFILSHLNSLIQSFKKGDKCATFSLKRIRSAATSVRHLNQNSVKIFMIRIETIPSAVFEATIEVVRKHFHNVFRLSGDISRLTEYHDTSQCIQDNVKLEKYCYCK